jgi:hypothetical protein
MPKGKEDSEEEDENEAEEEQQKRIHNDLLPIRNSRTNSFAP